MTERLRVLVAEDSDDDFAMLVRALGKGGFAVDAVRVQTAVAMQSALNAGPWDLIVSDWSMPGFTGPQALALVREAALDLPFIIVSGTVGEDAVVDALRNGAHDFLIKDKLSRLVPAVERELREAVTRRERNRMREQLLISDRMASVGILAAGVVHEINNPLAAVMANLELAAGDVETLIEQSGASTVAIALREELADARSAANRLRVIVRDMMVFSRSETEQRGSVDVRAVLEASLRMASHEIRHRARLITEFGDVPPILASEARISQVFLNLIVNAAQAIPEGRANDNTITIRTRVEGHHARIEVEDTGPGIPPEVMRYLFTPFLTTKPAGVGTGLGLSICHRIVGESGGDISVTSAPGATVFVVRLLLASADLGTR